MGFLRGRGNSSLCCITAWVHKLFEWPILQLDASKLRLMVLNPMSESTLFYIFYCEENEMHRAFVLHPSIAINHWDCSGEWNLSPASLPLASRDGNVPSGLEKLVLLRNKCNLFIQTWVKAFVIMFISLLFMFYGELVASDIHQVWHFILCPF